MVKKKKKLHPNSNVLPYFLLYKMNVYVTYMYQDQFNQEISLVLEATLHFSEKSYHSIQTS